MTDKQRKEINDFEKELFDKQTDIPKEFNDIFNDNFWDLIK